MDRGVYELRCVGYVDEPDFFKTLILERFSVSVQAYMKQVRKRKELKKVCNYILFLNFLTSMFHECDYIKTKPLIPSIWEIAICNMNWKNDDKLRRYFHRLTNDHVKFIGSFYSNDLLTRDEFPFNEIILLETFPSPVFDSRAIIQAKLDGLYFFANTCDCRYINNELIFSECYMISATEYNLHSNNQMSIYNVVRSEAATKAMAVFPKFLKSFSVSDTLVSPSGHALRMFVEHSNSNASLWMFVHKILSNFFNSKPLWVVNHSVYFPTNFDMRPERLERTEDTVWHSVEEWLLGYIPAGILLRM